MKNDTMEYRGYVGTIEWSEEDNVFYGEVLNILSLITYQGDNIEELEKDFHEALDLYLELRESDGWKEERPIKYHFGFNVYTYTKYRLRKEARKNKRKLLNNPIGVAK